MQNQNHEFSEDMIRLRAVLLHLSHADAYGTLVRVQSLDRGEGLDSLGETEQAVSS